jgi:translation initiation factor 2 beta subunit (eIF-2beta)/eIF-5
MEFNTMLDDVYNELGLQVHINPNLPEIDLENEKGKNRLRWKNIKEFLKITRTPPDHLFDFLRYQIDKNIDIGWYSDSVSDGLIIHDVKKINKTIIFSLMKKYLIDFVICKICRKMNTHISKDITIRKWQIKCSDCNSEYTV